MKQFYFQNETAQDKFNCIDFEFSCTYAPWVTVITLKNGNHHHGFLHNYPDSDELAKEHKFRLVIQNQSLKFRDELRDKKFYNPDYSAIIYAGDVASIELVNAHEQTKV